MVSNLRPRYPLGTDFGDVFKKNWIASGLFTFPLLATCSFKMLRGGKVDVSCLAKTASSTNHTVFCLQRKSGFCFACIQSCLEFQ